MQMKDTELYRLTKEYTLEEIVEAAKGLEFTSFTSASGVVHKFKDLFIHATGQSRWLKCTAYGNGLSSVVKWNVCNTISDYETYAISNYPNDCMSDESALQIRHALTIISYAPGDRLSLINE